MTVDFAVNLSVTIQSDWRDCHAEASVPDTQAPTGQRELTLAYDPEIERYVAVTSPAANGTTYFTSWLVAFGWFLRHVQVQFSTAVTQRVGPPYVRANIERHAQGQPNLGAVRAEATLDTAEPPTFPDL